jgi:sugar lactone lactonase YvrE
MGAWTRAGVRLIGFAVTVAALAAIGARAAVPDAGVSAAGGAPGSPLADIGQVELVKSDFVFVEGLRWVPALGALLVSDPYGETIYKLTTPPDRFDPFRPHSNGANGLDVDARGHLVAAEVGANREKSPGAVSRQRDDGTWADAIRDYRGLTLGHPNDLVALPDGTIFFSDLALAPHRLLRIDPAGVLSHPLDTGDARMNGLALSPDRKTFYAGGGGMVQVYDVAGGKLGQLRATYTTEPTPDGLCVDRAGNLFVGTQRGVQVWNTKTGTPWGLIALPGLTGKDRATECAFADRDARTLYMAAVSKLFRVRLARPGVY